MTNLTLNRAVYPCKWIMIDGKPTCPIVPAFIGHTQGYLMLDTGSSITILDEHFFSKNFPDMQYVAGSLNIDSVAGGQELRMLDKMMVRVGHIGGELSLPAVGAIKNLIHTDEVPVVGILGMDFIHLYCARVDLDLKRELVTLYVAK